MYVYETAWADQDNHGRTVRRIVCQHFDGESTAGSFYAKSPQEMIEHLLEHRRQGDDVPEYALDRLRKEAEEPW